MKDKYGTEYLMMSVEEVKKLWNSQADEFNQWEYLSEDEMVEFALSIRVEKLINALNSIAYSPFCRYEEVSGNSYGMGVADGHRYCAQIARDALKELKEGKGDLGLIDWEKEEAE